MIMLRGVPGRIQTEEVPEAYADHAFFILLDSLYELQQTLFIRNRRAVIFFTQILTIHKAAAVFIESCQVDSVDALLIRTVLLADIGSHSLYKILGESALQPGECIIVKIR